MKLPSVPLMLVAMALPFSVHAQLFSGCTDKVLADWSFDTKTLNPDYVDPSVSVTMNPIGVPNNGVGYGQGPGGAGDFVACFPNFNVDGYIDFGIKSNDCINLGGLTFDYLTESSFNQTGPTVLNFSIYDSVSNDLLFQTNHFNSSTSAWQHFDINDTASYNGVSYYNNNGWENLASGEGLRFEIGGWYGNTWQIGLDINNLQITGCACIPEPTTSGLAGLAGLFLVLRRRR